MPYEHVLTPDEKRELVRIARATLREYLRSGRIPPGKPHRESLVAPAGCFVTLRRGETLRGWAAQPEDTQPVYRAIQETAVAAATRDPRFPALLPDELDDLTIEISVLGCRARITSPAQIELGVHGVAVELDGHRGALLPQNAVEAGWDAPTFLSRACVKAGLPSDAWTHADAIIEVFTAQVFGDPVETKSLVSES